MRVGPFDRFQALVYGHSVLARSLLIVTVALLLPIPALAAPTPADGIGRLEFLRAVAAARGFDAGTETIDRACFTDVDPTSEGAAFLCSAKAGGVIRGYRDGSFRAQALISRAEAAAMIASMFVSCPILHRITADDLEDYPDRDFVEIAMSHGWLLPRARGFEPRAHLSRAEAARVLSLLTDAPRASADGTSCYAIR
jgi:S-layer homology domain